MAEKKDPRLKALELRAITSQNAPLAIQPRAMWLSPKMAIKSKPFASGSRAFPVRRRARAKAKRTSSVALHLRPVTLRISLKAK